MTPADDDPPTTDEGTSTESAPEQPGFSSRGRARRRARFLRRARELAYRDLGGLVFNLHRFGQRNDALVLAKLNTLSHIDSELRAIEGALRERRPLTVLREAGITACPRCAAIHGSEDRFCPNCGFAIARHADLPIAGAPSTPAPEPAPATHSAPPTQIAAPAPAAALTQVAAPAPAAPATQIHAPTAAALPAQGSSRSSTGSPPAIAATAAPELGGAGGSQAVPLPVPVSAEPASQPAHADPTPKPTEQPAPAGPTSRPAPAESTETAEPGEHTAVRAGVGRSPTPPRADEPEQDEQAGETTEILRPRAGGS